MSANAFSDRIVQLVADNRIRAAIEAGDFDHLRGLGRPCELIDEPYDPFWWIRRKLHAEQLRTTPADWVI